MKRILGLVLMLNIFVSGGAFAQTCPAACTGGGTATCTQADVDNGVTGCAAVGDTYTYTAELDCYQCFQEGCSDSDKSACFALEKSSCEGDATTSGTINYAYTECLGLFDSRNLNTSKTLNTVSIIGSATSVVGAGTALVGNLMKEKGETEADKKKSRNLKKGLETAGNITALVGSGTSGVMSGINMGVMGFDDTNKDKLLGKFKACVDAIGTM